MKFNEIRLNKKGEFDDIAIDNLHLEDMDGKTWWLGLYRKNKRICFWLSSKSKIKVTLQENGLKTKIVQYKEIDI